MIENILVLPLLIPVTFACLGLLFRTHNVWNLGMQGLGATAMLAVSILILWFVWQQDILVLRMGGWQAPWGIVLVADRLAAIMVVVCNVILVATLAYMVMEESERKHTTHQYPLVFFLMMGINGAFLTGDLFNLYVWFEVMLIASFVLLVGKGSPAQLEGGFKYVTINIFASFMFLAGIGILYGKTGTLNMADIANALIDSEESTAVNTSIVLLVVAFGIKSALFPFFFWLPASYHTLPTPLAALFAGLLTKVGVYTLIRAFTLFFGTSAAAFQPILVWIAAATMVVGVFGAASQFDYKKVLSFHIISQIGYIIMGLALLTPFGIAAAIFYTVHHIIVKSNLFLVGGLIAKHTGTFDLKQMGGLFRTAPALALLFAIPAMSLGGIPPLSGFWAKLAVISAAVEISNWLLASVALFVGVLTLYSMSKLWTYAFWQAAPEHQATTETPEPASRWIWLPSAVLAALTVWIGLSPEALFQACEATAAQLFTPEIYVRAILNPR